MKKIRIAALVIAVFVFMLSYLAVSSGREEKKESRNIEGKQISVVVAARDIRPDTELTQEMLSIQNVFILDGNEDYFSSVSEAVGRIAVADIYQGEIVTAKRSVSADDETLGLAHHIAPGMRAVSLTLPAENGVGYNLKVGDYVDVIFGGEAEVESIGGDDREIPAGIAFTNFYDEESPENSAVVEENFDKHFSAIAIQNVRVAALDTLIHYEAAVQEKGYDQVTLEVTPEQAEKLVLLRAMNAPVFLALRSNGDEENVHGPRVNVLSIYEENAESGEDAAAPQQTDGSSSDAGTAASDAENAAADGGSGSSDSGSSGSGSSSEAGPIR